MDWLYYPSYRCAGFNSPLTFTNTVNPAILTIASLGVRQPLGWCQICLQLTTVGFTAVLNHVFSWRAVHLGRCVIGAASHFPLWENPLSCPVSTLSHSLEVADITLSGFYSRRCNRVSVTSCHKPKGSRTPYNAPRWFFSLGRVYPFPDLALCVVIKGARFTAWHSFIPDGVWLVSTYRKLSVKIWWQWEISTGPFRGF